MPCSPTLARHPATAKHIATKLARHFVADDPPPALVERLAKRFLRHRRRSERGREDAGHRAGSLGRRRARKLKRPGEWLVGALRAAGVTPPDIAAVMQAHNLLGEPLWRPPAPKGFADDSAAWIDGLAQRLDIANQLGAAHRPSGRSARACSRTALGPLASPETRQAIARAESRPQALALLLMAPEFQRRCVTIEYARHDLPSPMLRPPCADPPNCCSPPARCSPGPICRSSRAPKAAIRACSSIVLRGALDGLGRGRAGRRSRLDRGCAATRRSRSTASRRRCRSIRSSRSIRRCRTCIASTRPAQATIVHAVGDALSRALAFRRPGRAGKRPAASRAPADTGWLNRALASLEPAGRAGQRPRGFRGRADHAAGRARSRAGAVVDAAAPAAGERRHADAAARPLPPHRSGARARARGAHGPCRHRARRRHRPTRGQQAAARPGAAQVRAVFRRSRGRRGEVPGACRMGRASARSPSTAGTPTPTRAPATAGSRMLLGALDGAIARDRDRAWGRPGARPSSP